MGGGGPLNNNADPDFVPYDCLTPEQVENYLMETVETVAKSQNVSQSCKLPSAVNFNKVFQVSLAEARVQLHQHRWSISALDGHRSSLLTVTICSPTLSTSSTSSKPMLDVLCGPSGEVFCDVCAIWQTKDSFSHLTCGHWFCKSCWELHFVHQIEQGVSTGESIDGKPNVSSEIIIIFSSRPLLYVHKL